MNDLGGRLGDLVRALRRAAEMSQRELAKASGVNKSTIAELESEEMLNPRISTLLQLAQVVRWQIVFIDASGNRVEPYQSGVAFDKAGRELPVHLDARPRPEADYWWQREGGYTYARRPRRRRES